MIKPITVYMYTSLCIYFKNNSSFSFCSFFLLFCLLLNCQQGPALRWKSGATTQPLEEACKISCQLVIPDFATNTSWWLFKWVMMLGFCLWLLVKWGSMLGFMFYTESQRIIWFGFRGVYFSGFAWFWIMNCVSGRFVIWKLCV